MGLLTIFLLALGLSTDAFAVAVSNGMCSCEIRKKNAAATAIVFGFFQALMPVIGYYLGYSFYEFISRFQHWIALFLLSAIGFNMMMEALTERNHPEESCCSNHVFTSRNLILQGIATSIDALAAGVSFVAMQVNIVKASLLIGTTTFLCCYTGVYIGNKFGTILGIRARLFGGIILILLGIKLFLQHLLGN